MRGNLRLVWSNRGVRRVQLAYLGMETAAWVYLVAVLVWTYEAGGAALVGTYAGIRLLCSAVAVPVGGVVADRMSRRNYLIACNLIRLPLIVVAALCITLDLGVWPVLVPGVLLGMISVTFRPAQAALLPTLVEEPRELTAANATAETIQGTTGFMGPAIGGLLVSVLGVAPVVLLSTLGAVWAIVLLRGVPRDRVAPSAGESGGSVLGGFSAIRADRDLSVLTGFFVVGGTLLGVYMVVLVVIAGEWVGDPAAVGWMNALSGAASIAGGIIVISLADRIPLARLTLIGSLGSCLGLAILGGAPHVVVIALVMILMGLTEPMIYIGLGTIPQRLVPSRLVARVVSATNAVGVFSAALGAFMTPVLLHHIGLRWTLVIGGLAGVVLTMVIGARVPRIDQRLAAPRGLALLAQVPMLAPLSPVLLEQVVQRLEPVEVPAGTAVIREGEVADRFYVIESGEVEVTQGGRVLRTQGVGEEFGEIGLLRDVPRTATVTAEADTVLLTLPREEFLSVLAGDARVHGLADDLVRRRLGV